MNTSAYFSSHYTIFSAMALGPDQFIGLSNALILDNHQSANPRLIQSENGFTHLYIDYPSLDDMPDSILYAERVALMVSKVLGTNQVVNYSHLVMRDSDIEIIQRSIDKHGETTYTPPQLDIDLESVKDVHKLPPEQRQHPFKLSGSFYGVSPLEYTSSGVFALDDATANKINRICLCYEWGEYESLEVVKVGVDQYRFAAISSDHGTIYSFDELEENEELQGLGETLHISQLIDCYVRPFNPNTPINVINVYLGSKNSHIEITDL